jgi:hypothetical protein
MKGGLIRSLLVWGVRLCGAGVTGLILHEDRPIGTPGAEADAFARKMQAAVKLDAWDAMEAIRWDFGGRQQHLWDKRRNLIRVRWKDIEVLRPLDTAKGIVKVDGKPVEGEREAELLKAAYAHWANDSFWLNPIGKLFDEGVTRGLAKNGDGETGLLITYSSGGVTPGDAYLWLVDANHRPTAWQMWVSIIPVGGVKATWSEWVDVAGAQISTAHDIGPLPLALTDVVGGALSDVAPGGDPFAALTASR